MLGCLSRMARPTISNGSEGNIIMAQFHTAGTKIPLENAAEIISHLAHKYATGKRFGINIMTIHTCVL